MAFIIQALVFSIFIEIHIVKRQKEISFSYLFLKLFIDYQRISLKRLSNSFVCNQKAHTIKILYYALSYTISISKIARCDLQNIGALIFSIT